MPPRDPAHYMGREQTLLKHRVLEEYLAGWAIKRASVARAGHAVRLWYVDCFAGPWKSRDDDLTDTSIWIGLEELKKASEAWVGAGQRIKLDAIFVEKDPAAFAELEAFKQQYTGPVEIHTYPGEFGAHVQTIQRHIGKDCAFLFVDPTGWKGAAMRFIAPLASKADRDVLINVMLHHINRFKDDPRTFLRDQMREFFGLGDEDLPAGLSEEDLIGLYRDQLRSQCGIRFVADLAVLHPVKEQTKFRLVVGGHHSAVLELFRDVERKVIGGEAAEARSVAKDREKGHGDDLLLFGSVAPTEDSGYAAQRLRGLREVREHLPELLVDGAMRYSDLWPRLLERCHLTKADLGQVVWTMRQEGTVVIEGVAPRGRSVKDQHIVRLPRTT